MNNRRKVLALLALMVLLLSGGVAQAEVGVSTNLFRRGSTRVSASAAMASSMGNEYFVLGIGAGYYLARGLEVGIDGEAWWGEDPNVYKVSPQIRYIFLQSPKVTPYVGLFYRRTFFDGLDDLDSAGGRAGIYTRLGSNGFAGFGLVHERYADCDDSVYSSCSTTYPEITFSLSL